MEIYTDSDSQRDALILAAHHNLSAPLIWVWDNLNIRLAATGLTIEPW